MTRLIDEDNIEKLAFYDVSDTQIYGAKHRRHLTGSLAYAAESAGCFPTTYQTIHWLCFVFLPVWPLGTYIVMPCKECDDPDGDADQYRAIRIHLDYSQIVLHYMVFLSVLSAVGLGVRWWLLYGRT